mmetsp:Transcript_95299/g.246288  ORF Transcript_95299/g.246288 Transcript_95299/m.246288 type:complete len:573 (+) Transcript_95299:697-2415(+)
MVEVKLAEDVPCQGELLAHALPQLLEHCRQVVRPAGATVLVPVPRVLIAVNEVERTVVNTDLGAGVEVRRLEEVAGHLVGVHRLLQELARDDAAITLRRLVDGQCVVEEVEIDDKHAVSFLRFRVRDLRREAEHHAGVLEELDSVFPGRLRHERAHGAQGVVPGAVARVGRRRGARHSALGQAHVDGLAQLDAELRAVVLARERIRIVDEELVAEHGRRLSDAEVLGVDALLLEHGVLQGAAHLGIAALDAGPAEEDREVVPAGVQRVLLPDLHGVVREEQHDAEGPPLELGRRQVVHDGVEAADLAVPLHELLHVRVDVAAAKLRLAVLPVGGLRDAGSFHLDRRAHEVVRLQRLARSLVEALLRIVVARPFVAIHDLDRAPVDVQNHAHGEVLPHQVAAVGAGEAVATDELALRDATVVLLLLDDLARVVLQVVHDGAMPYPVIFQVRLHHGLLEEAVEAQDVAVERIPGGHLGHGPTVDILVALRLCRLTERADAARFRHLRCRDHLRFLVGDALRLLHTDPTDGLEVLGAGLVRRFPPEAVARQVRDVAQVQAGAHHRRHRALGRIWA